MNTQITYFLALVALHIASFVTTNQHLDKGTNAHILTLILILGWILSWFWNRLLSEDQHSPKWHWGWLSVFSVYSVIFHYIMIVSRRK